MPRLLPACGDGHVCTAGVPGFAPVGGFGRQDGGGRLRNCCRLYGATREPEEILVFCKQRCLPPSVMPSTCQRHHFAAFPASIAHPACISSGNLLHCEIAVAVRSGLHLITVGATARLSQFECIKFHDRVSPAELPD